MKPSTSGGRTPKKPKRNPPQDARSKPHNLRNAETTATPAKESQEERSSGDCSCADANELDNVVVIVPKLTDGQIRAYSRPEPPAPPMTERQENVVPSTTREQRVATRSTDAVTK